jgi:hypothetical protein
MTETTPAPAEEEPSPRHLKAVADSFVDIDERLASARHNIAKALIEMRDLYRGNDGCDACLMWEPWMDAKSLLEDAERNIRAAAALMRPKKGR